MSRTAIRLTVVAIALAVIVGAVMWSSVTFTDRSYACGTAWGEARRGETMPAIFFGPEPPPPGAFEIITSGPGANTVTLCRGQARARLAESAAVIVIALVGVGVALRPRRRQPPEVATV